MTPRRQFWLISLVALAVFLVLRSLPDTHCALLHSDHQPVIVQGLEFCGVNEEANFYRPKDLNFPFEFKIELPDVVQNTPGKLWIRGANQHPLLDHEIAVSHTQKVHLHLRQVSGRSAYVHLHPQPQSDGSWTFNFPPEFQVGNPGGHFLAYVDFVSALSGRSVLGEAEASMPVVEVATPMTRQPLKIVSENFSTHRTNEVALVRLKLAKVDGGPLKLQPLMGTLGHAVLFATQADEAHRGYAHLHPSLEGGEYEAEPTLAFRLRLLTPGFYDFWVHVNDGSDRYLKFSFAVTP